MRRFEVFAYSVTLLCACVTLSGATVFGAALVPGVPVATNSPPVTQAGNVVAKEKSIGTVVQVLNVNAQALVAALRAEELLKSGRTEEAIAEYNHYIELLPNESAGYTSRGLLLSNLGDQQAAFRDYDKARQIDDNDAVAWDGVGMTYLRRGDPKSAIPFINHSLRLNPENHWAWNNLACAHAALGKFQDALKDESKAIEYNPTFGHHHFKRGLIYKAIGNAQQANRNFQKARELGFDVDAALKASQLKR